MTEISPLMLLFITALLSGLLGLGMGLFLSRNRARDHEKSAIEYRARLEAEGDLTNRQQAIDQLVKPLHEALTKVDSRIGELEQARSGAYARLDEQLKTLMESQRNLDRETGNLVKALRTPSVR